MNELPLRVGFVPGVMPSKWAGRWREWYPKVRLDLALTEQDEALSMLRANELDCVFVRMPFDPAGLNVVKLYQEQFVVCFDVDHEFAILEQESLSVAQLAGCTLLQDLNTITGLPDASVIPAAQAANLKGLDDLSIAFDVVASGAGQLILPMSVARLHHRKDVEFLPLSDLPTVIVAVAWRNTPAHAEVDPHTHVVENFVGIARGRRAASSRQTALEAEKAREQERANTPREKRPTLATTAGGKTQKGTSRGEQLRAAQAAGKNPRGRVVRASGNGRPNTRKKPK